MGEPLRLWSEEIEEMRAEARAAVEAGSDMFTGLDVESSGLSREERVRLQREAMPSVPAPEAVGV